MLAVKSNIGVVDGDKGSSFLPAQTWNTIRLQNHSNPPILFIILAVRIYFSDRIPSRRQMALCFGLFLSCVLLSLLPRCSFPIIQKREIHKALAKQSPCNATAFGCCFLPLLAQRACCFVSNDDDNSYAIRESFQLSAFLSLGALLQESRCYEQ